MKVSQYPMNKVDVVVERQWHIGPHAAALAKMRCLGRVYGGFPAYRYRALGIDEKFLRTNCLPAVWNQVAGSMKLRQWTADAPKILARWVAGQKDLSRYINCYSTVYRHLFPILSHRKHILILERGSTHPEEFFERINRGLLESGLPRRADLPAGVQEEIEAGKLAHFIVAGSRMICDSYVNRGHAPERVLLIPYAVNHEFFRFQERSPRKGPIKIACVGIIGVRKGLPRLLKIADWAGKAGIPVEIHLVGPLEAEAHPLLAQAGSNVLAMGVKKGDELVREFHDCDLYCLPSYEEGFGISVLEAMSTGIPAIVSNDTGGREAITHGVDGLILHGFNEGEFDDALRPLLESAARRVEMGAAARRKIESGYTLAHYEARLISEYQRMLDIVEAAGGNPTPAWR